VLPDLQQIIDGTHDEGDLTFLMSDHCRGLGERDSFGNRFQDR
jgi:hypothetical protein